MAGYFKLESSTHRQYYFTLHAENNENLLTSEMYVAKASAEAGIESVKRNAIFDANYQRKVSSRGLHYFTLTALNNQVLGTSEEYNSQQARENGISAVKRVAPTARVIDNA